MALISGRRPGAGTWRMVAALVRQRRRLALATVAIALGVGYLAGALTLLDRVSAGLDDLAAAGAEQADLVVEGSVAYESALEQTRRLVPSSVVDTVGTVPGVAAVVPRMEEITLLLDADQVPLVAPGLSEQPLGSNWPDDPLMSPYRFVGEGRPPEAEDEIVIDVGSAERASVSVGETITVAGRTKIDTYTVVGVVTTGEGRLPAGATLALFTTDEARLLFDAQDNVNRVAIRLEDGADAATVADQIRSMLPPGAELVDGATAAEHRQESLTRSFALIRVLIMGFAGLALVVGMITVSNSLTLLYAERRRTLAAFRLVGAKQHQLMGAALIEAALLAGIASVIGAPLGLVLGRLIEAVLGALGTSVPVGGPVVSVPALVTAVLVGAAATILAAVMPARRACRVAPVEAVMEAPRDPVGSTGQRILDASVVALGVGVAVAGMALLFDVDTRLALIVGAAATGLLVLAAVLPWALSSAVAAGISVIPLRPTTLRRIAARDAVRNRSRTAATTGALMLATAVVAGLAVFLSSFAASLDGDVDQLVTSDLVIDSGTFTRGGLPVELLDETAQLESVGAVSGWQSGRVTIGELPVRLTGIDGAALNSVLSPGWVGAAPPELGLQGILLEAEAAASLGASLGDSIPVYFTSDGVEMLTLEGIYARGSLLLGEAVIDRSTLMRQVPASVDIAALVSLNDDTPAARAEVADLARSFGVTTVLDPGEFVDHRSDLLHGFERVIQWMLFFTLIQALVGVVNTLLLSVGERRREFGLLRAAGAGAKQIHRLVLAEGLSFAVIGTVLGLALGVFGAAMGIRALGRFGISGLDIPVVVLIVTSLAAVALGVAAAVVPARWAASVPPLEAVSDIGAATVRPRRVGRWSVGRQEPRPTRTERPTRPTVPAAAGAAWGTGPFAAPAAPAAPRTAAAPRASTTPPWASPHPRPGPLFGVPAAAPKPAPAPPRPATSAPVSPAPPPIPRPVVAPQPEPETQPVAALVQPPPYRPAQAAAAETAPPPPPARAVRGWRAGEEQPALDPVASIRLADALERLDPQSVRDALPALVPLARTLDADEQVLALVQGWTKGLLCIAVRTDRRIVIVVDRFPDPLIESLDPVGTGVFRYGPPSNDRISVSIVDGNRLLEVSGVRDVQEATALQTARSVSPLTDPSAPANAPEYF